MRSRDLALSVAAIALAVTVGLVADQNVVRPAGALVIGLFGAIGVSIALEIFFGRGTQARRFWPAQALSAARLLIFLFGSDNLRGQVGPYGAGTLVIVAALSLVIVALGPAVGRLTFSDASVAGLAAARPSTGWSRTWMLASAATASFFFAATIWKHDWNAGMVAVAICVVAAVVALLTIKLRAYARSRASASDPARLKV